MKWRIHLITLLIFFGSFAFLKLLWEHPAIILYVLFFIIGILAYGGIYLMVKSKMSDSSE